MYECFSGQDKQIILPNSANFGAGQQLIQLPGQNGQPGQLLIVPSGNVVLLSNNQDQSASVKTMQGEIFVVKLQIRSNLQMKIQKMVELIVNNMVTFLQILHFQVYLTMST